MGEPSSTERYWETRYITGGNSGSGSYGRLALYKASFLNRFVRSNKIFSVGELGCGDGSQLMRSSYPKYIGYDIAAEAVKICKEKFLGDVNKEFYCLGSVASLKEVDLSVSLDVIYHLLEDAVYEEHISQLFRMASRFVIIYANGCVRNYSAGHVNLRDFNSKIAEMYPNWSLIDAERNPFYSEVGTDPNLSWSNFYIYQAPRSKSSLNHYTNLVLGRDIEERRPPMISMSREDFESKPASEWRKMARSYPDGTQIAVDIDSSSLSPCDMPPVRLRYVRELLPEMKSTEAKLTNKWIGNLITRPEIIVSLTTIKSRLGSLHRVLESIIGQSQLPDKIILNISREPYLMDEGINEDDIPSAIVDLADKGFLKINYVENTGPYRKLLPVLSAEWQSNCVIVTADDDTIYRPFWIDELYNTYLSNPRNIVARRCWTVNIENREIAPYSTWFGNCLNKDVKPEYQDLFVFPTGKDGVLYSPDFFTELVFDPELIQIAPTCDDLAFKFATLLTNTGVSMLSRSLSTSGVEPEYPTVSQGGLWVAHNSGGKNDQSVSLLLKYFSDRGGFDLRTFLTES